MDFDDLLYSAQDYKAFLADVLESDSNLNWGGRSKLAKAMGCQPAYVSRVFAGLAELSLEQVERAGRFLNLNEPQQHFLFLLCQENRAGSSELKGYFSKQRKQLINERKQIRNRVKIEGKLRRKVKETYYNSWHYGAVHVAAVLDCNPSSESIAASLGLSVRRVKQILEFLVEHKILAYDQKRYLPSIGSVHLDKTDPMIKRHHMNWHLKALAHLESLESESTNNSFHYSAAMTLSKMDIEKIEEILRKAISRSNKLVGVSKSEEAYVMLIDFFSLAF